MAKGVVAGLPPGVDIEDVRRELARRSFIHFVKYTKPDYIAEPVHEYLAKRLQAFIEACERRESPRLILMMPPQHGKSQLSSRHLPAWIIGRHANWRVVLMSYSADWARDLSQDARDILLGDEYQSIWPYELDKSSTAVDDWKLTRKAGGGGMLAVGKDGSVTGRPAEVVIVDDPVKNRIEADSQVVRDQTWKNWTGFRNRLQRGGGILILYTPWHYDDLPARLRKWAEENPEADQWEVVNLPALAEDNDPLGRQPGEPLAPNRYPLKELKQLRASMPESEWQALYCGRPTSEAGAIIHYDWLESNREADPHNPGWVFMAADTAYSKKRTADYTVVTVWRVEKAHYRLLHVYRERVDFPELKRDIALLDIRWQPDALLVEDIGSGKSLAQELKAETRIPVIEWKPDRDKVSRASSITHLLAGGKVKFPIQADWWRAYMDELIQFPAAAHDDQVDATSMALTWARDQEPKMTPTHQTSVPFTWDKDMKEDDSGLYAELGIYAGVG